MIAMKASCKDDDETAQLLIDHSSKLSAQKLHNSLQLFLEKAAGNVDKEKSEESDIHEKIEEIDSSSIFFFFARVSESHGGIKL